MSIEHLVTQYIYEIPEKEIMNILKLEGSVVSRIVKTEVGSVIITTRTQIK